jgi:hypothetical protein
MQNPDFVASSFGILALAFGYLRGREPHSHAQTRIAESALAIVIVHVSVFRVSSEAKLILNRPRMRGCAGDKVD